MKTAATLAVVLVLAACTPGASMSESGGSILPTASAPAATRVAGRAVAGPVCPVESVSPDPSCAPRTVAGAELLILDAEGTLVETLHTDRDGRFATTLAPGTYRLEPQPVAGILGTAPPIDLEVEQGRPLDNLVVGYDTGIR